MDQQRFDDLARRLATGGHRRTLLKIALGLVAATTLKPARGARSQAACEPPCAEGQVCQDGACLRPCVTHRDCRSKKDDPCISNTCVDGFCVEAIVDCQPGFECCKGECCSKSCETDAECAVLDPCRRGSCSPEGQCVFTYFDPCILCQSDEECVDGANTICCGGACKRPCPDGAVMGKGCECRASMPGTMNGLVVRDDASGSDGTRTPTP
jgi:hypothetical protein